MSARVGGFEVPSHRRFSRQWFMDCLRTFCWVAVITVLIWVYADITQTEEQSVSLSLEVRGGSGRDVVLLGASNVPVQARFRGSRHAIGRFAARFADRSLPFDTSKLPPKRNELETAALLSRMPQVRQAGLTVLSARPASIHIELAALVLVSAPIRFEYTGGEPSDVKIEPDRVELYVPARYRGQIDTLGTETVDLRDKSAEKTHVTEVKVRAPTGVPGCRLKTHTVKVSFKVGRQIVTKKFNVPLAVQSPRAWLSDDTWTQYKLEIKGKELTQEIAVRGHRIDLEKLRAGGIRAYIVLTEDDKRALDSWLPGQVRVQLRQDRDLKAKHLEVIDPPKVEYRLVKRSKAPSPP